MKNKSTFSTSTFGSYKVRYYIWIYLNKTTMAILTEKEWDLELGSFLNAKLYAEYRNGILSDLYAMIELDGFYVSWSNRHELGMIRIYEVTHLTQDYSRLLYLLNADAIKVLETKVKEIINGNFNKN